MRIAYLDCFSGISGDMFLGALVDAGVPIRLLEEAVAALGVGAKLRVSQVDRSGITATKIDVLVDGEVDRPRDVSLSGTDEQNLKSQSSQRSAAEDAKKSQAQDASSHGRGHSHQHDHSDGHAHEHNHSHPHSDAEELSHGHEHSQHEHAHPHAHAHGRHLKEIKGIIRMAAISDSAKRTAIAIFEALGAAEAKIHNMDIEHVHFHEVGAVDALVDIVGAAVGAEALGVDEIVCSPLNVGGGTVKCAHGVFPVPAPATVELLKGAPVFSSGVHAELVTPTGAAIVKTLAARFAAFPPMKIEKTGYGAGSRDFSGHANVVRITIGESIPKNSTFIRGVLLNGGNSDASHVFADDTARSEASRDRAGAVAANRDGTSGDAASRISTGKFPRPDAAFAAFAVDPIVRETITVLEANLDDLNPQVFGYVMEKLLAEGALDAFGVPVQMKKNRPGTLLTVLCKPDDAAKLMRILFEETTTLGVRRRDEQRQVLERRWESVTTQWGDVRVKVASLNGTVTNCAPEYEDCRRIAEEQHVPLKSVMLEALQAYTLALPAKKR
jgi:pyridinium-3,5-bisthiocarboxylic acid mononucleotide nickel chelatase